MLLQALCAVLIETRKSIALQPLALHRDRTLRIISLRDSVLSSSVEEPEFPSEREVVEKIRELTLEDLEENDEIDIDTLPDLPADELDDSPLTPEQVDKIKSGQAALDAWMGEFDGRDDDLAAPWRTEAESIIRNAVTDLKVIDIAWDIGTLRITVTKDDNDNNVSAEDTGRAARSIRDALEPYDDKLRVLDRFELEVSSPGVANVLSMQRDFDTFKGFDIEVDTLNPITPSQSRTLQGKLVERTPIELTINQKGRIVKIPTNLVGEVRLPPSMEEDDPM
mmetsp:Transcript_7384/g.10263  ORF Transcript_7384/g.10263 Transcript_7384/m.10263 type:complete len:280 (-) Transcript_7384:209-1048(-)